LSEEERIQRGQRLAALIMGKAHTRKNTGTQIVKMTPLEWWCLWTLTIALELARRSTLVVLELCPRTYDGVLPNPCLLIS